MGRDRAILELRSEVELMPTAFQDEPYSFIFFSSDQSELSHIHVKVGIA